MTPSRLIIGLILTLTGTVLTIISFLTSLILLIYGPITIIIGIIILFNNNEDKIEQIKRRSK